MTEVIVINVGLFADASKNASLMLGFSAPLGSSCHCESSSSSTCRLSVLRCHHHFACEIKLFSRWEGELAMW